MADSVTELVHRLERWCDREADGAVGWNGPADPTAIDGLEDGLGRTLPVDVRQWLMVHDGQDWPGGCQPTLPTGMSFLSCEGILATWRELLPFADDDGSDLFYEMYQDHRRVRRIIYDRGRIPLAFAEGTAYLMLDLVPGPNGTEGQIIYLYTECDYVVVGRDFRDFLGRYLQLLNEGTLVFEDPDGGGAPHVRPADADWRVDEIWGLPAPAEARRQ